MSAVAPSQEDDAAIATCDTLSGLGRIAAPDVDLVIWRRAQPLCLRTWLERLDTAQLPDLRLLAPPSDLGRALVPLLDAHGMPQDDMRDLLVRDIAELAAAFARIARTDLVDVRLERVAHDGCWRFHRDCVEARLLTTYRGPATEWVAPHHAERALRAQTHYDGPLERFAIHDVAIFKGSRAGAGRGIVHRSPPIVGTGAVRLLLCLNTRSAASPEPWAGAREAP